MPLKQLSGSGASEKVGSPATKVDGSCLLRLTKMPLGSRIPKIRRFEDETERQGGPHHGGGQRDWA